MEVLFAVAIAVAAFVLGTFEGPKIVAWVKGLSAAKALKNAKAGDIAEQHVVVAVDRQAAESVTVGIHGAPGVGLFVELEPAAAECDGAVERRVEVVLTHRFGGVADHAQRDLGARIVEPGADALPELVVDGDKIAGLRVGRHPAEHARENVRLEGDELELRPRLGPRSAIRSCSRRRWGHGFSQQRREVTKRRWRILLRVAEPWAWDHNFKPSRVWLQKKTPGNTGAS